MSDHSPTKELDGKETSQYYAPEPTEDVEQGDPGIINHANPLSRKLKGRHMQMIAIGTYSSLTRQRRICS
jgi:amino acid permease